MLASKDETCTPDPLIPPQQDDKNDYSSTPSDNTTLSIEDAMERLGMGVFQRRITIAAGLCFAADSMEILLLSFLSKVLEREWKLTTTETSAITSSVFIGALLGSCILGPLGDAIGRRPVFILAATIISVFGLATAMARSFVGLLVIRFLVGFGVGGSTVPFDTLSEFLPTSHRGVHLLALEYFWTAGNFLVILFAYLTFGQQQQHQDESNNGSSWRVFVILCAIPCFLSSVLSCIVVPESPRWLCARGREDEALEILRKAAQTNGHDNVDALFPPGTILTTQEEHSTIRDLFSPQWKSITLRLWSVWLGQAILYYGAILAITYIFSSDDNDDDDPTFNYADIFLSSSAELVGLTLVIFIVDTVGRIPSATVCYVCGGMCVFLLCGLDWIGLTNSMLLPFSFGARLFLMGATCLTWVSTSEILSTEVRTSGHSAANAIARIGGAVSPYIIADAPLQVVGVVMLSISLIVARLTWKLPETKGVAMGMAVTKNDDGEESTELSVGLTSSNNEVI